ncbi:unnamed protein product, partial [Staurois parvus]
WFKLSFSYISINPKTDLTIFPPRRAPSTDFSVKVTGSTINPSPQARYPFVPHIQSLSKASTPLTSTQCLPSPSDLLSVSSTPLCLSLH